MKYMGKKTSAFSNRFTYWNKRWNTRPQRRSCPVAVVDSSRDELLPCNTAASVEGMVLVF